MHYWSAVLNEVLHKDDLSRTYFFTNQGNLSDEMEMPSFESESDSIKETRDLRTYYLTPQYPTVYFTRREAECIFWVVQGSTISHAALKMGLSARTVEFYVKNMKLKLQCTSKKELVDKVLQSSLLQQLEKNGMRIVRH